MTTETKRDLHADLAICNAATGGWWKVGGGKFGETNVYTYPGGHKVVSDIDYDKQADAAFIAEARTGWPHAIERAIRAEDKWEQLRAIVLTNATGNKGTDINDWDVMLNEMDDIMSGGDRG